jgi:hypothetical protein
MGYLTPTGRRRSASWGSVMDTRVLGQAVPPGSCSCEGGAQIRLQLARIVGTNSPGNKLSQKKVLEIQDDSRGPTSWPALPAACKPHATFWQDDGRQRWTRTGPVFRDLRLVVKLITRRAAGHERENRRPANASSSGADASNVSCSLYTYHARMYSPGPGQAEGEEGKGRGTHEIIL